MELNQFLDRYCSLLNEREFFEAHEILEEAWHILRRAKDDRAKPIRGLINAAIAFEHLKRERPKSFRVAKKAIGAYDRYRLICKSDFRECYLIVEKLRGEFGI